MLGTRDPPVVVRADDLAAIAEASMRALFDGGSHRPSADQWVAIRDLLRHLERAACGALAPAVYVSAIPAGTGKSASIAAFAKAFCDAPAFDRVGMLIAVNRVEEAKDMATALASVRDRLAVIVGKAHGDVIALGAHTEPTTDRAQVVVTTQAALKATLRGGGSFDDAARYHFQGRRRAVVAWDEALNFNRGIALDADTMGGLAKAMRRQSNAAAHLLLEWAPIVAKAAAHTLCDVPNFSAHGIDFRRLEDEVADRDDLVTQARAIEALDGGAGWIVRDNLGASIVTSVAELPPSLMPVIVTDASASTAVGGAGYDLMASARDVRRLAEASKTYRNLTIRTVATSASRSTYSDPKTTRGRDLIEMAVRYVKSVAPEDVLIVSYGKLRCIGGVSERTIALAIDARLTEAERKRVRHLTWGRHTATNAHSDVRHVLLMGLNFLRPSSAYAASGAAADRSMRTDDPSDHPTPSQVEATGRCMLKGIPPVAASCLDF